MIAAIESGSLSFHARSLVRGEGLWRIAERTSRSDLIKAPLPSTAMRHEQEKSGTTLFGVQRCDRRSQSTSLPGERPGADDAFSRVTTEVAEPGV